MLATKEMSKNKEPTIPFVLPTYFQLEAHLKSIMVASERTYGMALRSAATRGHAKLEKYFAMARKNQHYVLGTGELSLSI